MLIDWVMVDLAGAGLEEELVDRVRRALPLVDRPHHQRLPAPAVARCEHPRHLPADTDRQGDQIAFDSFLISTGDRRNEKDDLRNCTVRTKDN